MDFMQIFFKLVFSIILEHKKLNHKLNRFYVFKTKKIIYKIHAIDNYLIIFKQLNYVSSLINLWFGGKLIFQATTVRLSPGVN